MKENEKRKTSFKDFLIVWKAWLGVILIMIGLTIAIRHSDYWMLIISLIGIILCLLDRHKLKENESSRNLIIVTLVALTLSEVFQLVF